MVTYQQYVKGARQRKIFKSSAPRLDGAPFKNGICKRVYIEKPKKPNSAKRAVAKVKLSNGRRLIAYIPGFGHRLGKNDEVMVRGGRVPDLPGVRYHILRNKKRHIEPEPSIRSARRSKFGIKNPNIKRDAFVLTMRGRNRQRKRARLKEGRVLPRRAVEYKVRPVWFPEGLEVLLYTENQLKLKRRRLFEDYFRLSYLVNARIRADKSNRNCFLKPSLFYGLVGGLLKSFRQWRQNLRRITPIGTTNKVFAIGFRLMGWLLKGLFYLILAIGAFLVLGAIFRALDRTGCFDWITQQSACERQLDAWNLPAAAMPTMDELLEQPLFYIVQDLRGFVFGGDWVRPLAPPSWAALELARLINEYDLHIARKKVYGKISRTKFEAWRKLVESARNLMADYTEMWGIWRLRRLRFQYYEERKLYYTLCKKHGDIVECLDKVKWFLENNYDK